MDQSSRLLGAKSEDDMVLDFEKKTKGREPGWRAQ